MLDPFMGMGTTNLAYMVSNRNSIGVEIDAGITALAVENLKKSPMQLNTIIDDRLMKHRAFVDGLTSEKQEKCYLNVHHDFKVKTKQEMEIKIDHVVSVSVDGNVITCEYQ